MEKSIQSFLAKTINERVWNIRQRIGSMLVFEIGEQIEDGRGAYHFVLESCHWWLQQGKDSAFVDIVNSESSKENIISKISILNGKKLLHIHYNEKIASTIFDFDDDLFLRVAPYGNVKIIEQWLVFTKDQILKVMSDASVTVKSSEEK
jgi:hypothetical protein